MTTSKTVSCEAGSDNGTLPCVSDVYAPWINRE
jgi:hypothetical protein